VSLLGASSPVASRFGPSLHRFLAQPEEHGIAAAPDFQNSTFCLRGGLEASAFRDWAIALA
jgi:hypothetical protein